MPKVSIIVPVYNVEEYLPQCIQSLMNQTLYDIEIILVDDGSPDNCPALCDEFAKQDDRIKVIHKQNEGLGFARNSGLDIATGEYIGFVDSDDYVDRNMFEELYKATNFSGDVDAILAGYFMISKNNEAAPVQIPGFPTKNVEILDNETYIKNIIGTLPPEKPHQFYHYSVWKGIFSNKLISRYNIRFQSERIFISEDILFQIQFSMKAKKIALLPDRYYYHLYNVNSLTKTYNEKKFTGFVNLYKEICSYDFKAMNIPALELRTQRLLLSNAFYSICDTIKSLSLIESIKMVRKIINYPELKAVLRNYPINKMVISYKVFFSLAKHNSALLIVLLYKILKIKLQRT